MLVPVALSAMALSAGAVTPQIQNCQVPAGVLKHSTMKPMAMPQVMKSDKIARNAISRTDDATSRLRVYVDLVDQKKWSNYAGISVYNDEHYYEGEIQLYDDEGNLVLENNYADIDVAPGKYDIMIYTNRMVDMGDYMSPDYRVWTFMQGVDVSGDATVTIDPANATNVISTENIMPDGSVAKPQYVEFDENWNMTELDPGNMIGLDFDLSIFYKDECIYSGSVGVSPIKYDKSPVGAYDPYKFCAFHVSPNLGDDYTFTVRSLIFTPEDYDYGTVVTLVGQTGSTSGTMKNDLSSYHEADFNYMFSPIGRDSEAVGAEFTNPAWGNYYYPYGICLWPVYDEELFFAGSSISLKNPKYNKVRISSNPAALTYCNVALDPILNEYWKNSSGELMNGSSDQAHFNLFGNAEPEVAYLGSAWLANNDRKFPGNTALNCHVKDFEDVLNGTAPMLLTALREVYDPDADYYRPMNYAYLIGRMGEFRPGDMGTAVSETFVDGKSVAKGTINENFSWWYQNTPAVPENAVVKQTVDDTNFEMEGLTGGVKGEVQFDMSKVDHYAPSVTMLQFRNGEDKVSSYFNSGAEGEMRITAADLKCVQGDYFSWGGRDCFFEFYTPAEVAAEVAPHGTGNFVKVDLVEDPSKFFTPGYGAYYSCKLGVADKEGWYDLRLTVKDAVGNYQCQTIGLAFKIGERSGLEKVIDGEDIVITREGGGVVAGGASHVELFNAAGMMVASSETGSVDVSRLASGVYIVRATDGVNFRTAKVRL